MLLYKFRSLCRLDWVADILISQRLYCPRYFDLNDPFEGVCIVYKQSENPTHEKRGYYSVVDVDTAKDAEEDFTHRLCSLSDSYSDIRLWSHYADGHKGIAIEIDFSGAEHLPVKVTYHSGLNKHDEAKSFPNPGEMLTHKTFHWQHEGEYRILSEEEYYSINGRIRRVLLGPRCGNKEESIIKRLVQDDVCVERTQLNERTVQVELKTTRRTAKK
jgi:hypothetical protein